MFLYCISDNNLSPWTVLKHYQYEIKTGLGSITLFSNALALALFAKFCIELALALPGF